MQFVRNPTHRKNLSYDERSTNPLFIIANNHMPKGNYMTSTNISYMPSRITPTTLAQISEDIEKTVNSSKNIIRSCVNTLETECFSTRSNYSTSTSSLKPKVKIYRRQKSLSVFNR